MQNVDKKHHPTDSLIKCEILGYLLLSYSGVPQTLLLPALPAVCMGEGRWGEGGGGGGGLVFIYLFVLFCPHPTENFSSERRKREISPF